MDTVLIAFLGQECLIINQKKTLIITYKSILPKIFLFLATTIDCSISLFKKNVLEFDF
jgi:hypothetical protein